MLLKKILQNVFKYCLHSPSDHSVVMCLSGLDLSEQRSKKGLAFLFSLAKRVAENITKVMQVHQYYYNCMKWNIHSRKRSAH